MEEKPYVQQKEFKKDFPFEKKENSYFRSQVFQKKIYYKIIAKELLLSNSVL